MTPLSWNSCQRSLPSRVRSPTPPNTDTPPCLRAMLWISSIMTTVLPTRAPPKPPTFPALQIGFQEVDDLVAGLELFRLGRRFLQVGRGGVNRPTFLRLAPPTAKIDRPPQDFHPAPGRLGADGPLNRPAE